MMLNIKMANIYFGTDNLTSNKRSRKFSSIYTWNLQSDSVETFLI